MRFLIWLAALTLPAASANAGTPSRCDVNADGAISIADVQLLVNEALGVAPLAHDLNADGAVTVSDAQTVLNAAVSTVCITAGSPLITDFNPKSAPAGTLVTISGSSLQTSAGGPVVTLNAQGGGTIAAPVSSAFPSVVTFAIPAGAASGAIQLTADGGTATSSQPLTIVPASSFSLAASPASASLIAGQSIAYTVSLANTGGFSQLTALSVSGVPAGVSAAMSPAQIGPGQVSVLTLTAPSGQPTGASTLQVTASATVDGLPVTASANVALQVAAVTTSLIGRTVVADNAETPLAGVAVSMLGKDGNGNTTACAGSTVSDQAGNFALINLPMACVGPQLVGFNGLTATSPAGQYAGVNLVFTIVASQVTASPVLVHLPRIDNQETFNVQQNAAGTQTHAFTSIPGLAVVVYPGTVFTMPDGTQPNPFPLTAVQVPVDRLPDAKPNVPTMIRAFIVAFQPANATTNEPVAVYFPNSLNTPPGTDMVLMTLDPTHGTMVPYGTGAVSADGTQIVPDPDPAHPGHLYGLIHFDWHGPMPPPPDDNANGCGVGCDDSDGPGGDTGDDPGDTGDMDNGDGDAPICGDPVDPSTGLEVLNNLDIGLFGSRGRIYVRRYYRSLWTANGPFGIGTQHNYGYLLDRGTLAVPMLNLIMPDNTRIPFAAQPDGTFVNSTVPNFHGAIITSNASGQIVLRRRDGRQFLFNPESGLLSRLGGIVDRYGNTITLVRNPANTAQLTAIVDPVGRKLLLAYDTANRITSITDAIGRQVTYTYNSQGQLATYTNAEGGVTSYTYDQQFRLTSVTDPRGIAIATNEYDVNGHVSKQTMGDGSVLRFQYTLMNPLAATSPIVATQITDGLGKQFTYRFNEFGFLIQYIDALGQYRNFIRETYQGVTPSAPAMARQPTPKTEGQVGPGPLEGSNLIVGIAGPAECSTCGDAASGDYLFSYDSTGNLLSKTDGLGNVTKYAYETVFDRITTIKNALGQIRRFGYDSSGNLTSFTDANGGITAMTYNGYGQVTRITDPAGQQTSFTYNAFGDLASTTDALGKTQTYLYDGASRLLQTTDRLGRKSSITYDAMNRATSVRNANGEITHFSYDPAGNLLQVSDARNNTTSFTYDALSRVLTRTSPLGKAASWVYDRNGNITSFTDRRGQISQFTYDALNRPVHKQFHDGSTVDISYDDRGRVKQVDDSSGGNVSYTYDATGRVLSSTTPTGTVQYTRDALWRVATRQVVGAEVVTYNYDGAGNLLAANSTPASAGFSYDARNRLTGQSRSNGVNSSYSYDAVGRVLSIAHQKGATVINSQVMTYDAAGNRTDTQSNLAQSLITAAATSSFDVENRLLQRGGTTYTYDDNGNRLTETSSAGVTAYDWDSRDRLTTIRTAQGQTIRFRYDYRGMMIGKQTSGGTNESYLLDDRDNVVWQSVNNAAQSILSGRAIDQHIAVISATGVSFGLGDAVNSTVAVTASNGAQSGEFSYEPFGQESSQAGQYPFQFTGRTNAGVGGIYYYRARFYDSVAGQFMEQDPLDFEAGDANLYRYVSNRPLIMWDPTGLDETSTCSLYKNNCRRGVPGTCTCYQWFCTDDDQKPTPPPTQTPSPPPQHPDDHGTFHCSRWHWLFGLPYCVRGG